jgi:glyoxylase-like metal-dependent hydrolase (beta-lactamase superfamily II)
MYQSKVTQIAPATWFIETPDSSMYLLAGARQALLIDTSMGAEDYGKLVASLTPLPVIVANTHGHPDHIMGNGYFQEVYIHPGDRAWLDQEVTEEDRQWGRENLAPKFPPGFSVDEWIDRRPAVIDCVTDGQTFDLGERLIEVIATPGHTPGSICLLDRKQRYLATGDTLHGGVVWLQLKESLPLDTYLASLKKLQAFAAEFDFLLPGHGDKPVPAQALPDMIAGVERILAGELVGEPTETSVAPGLQCLFATCGILYGRTPAADPAAG